MRLEGRSSDCERRLRKAGHQAYHVRWAYLAKCTIDYILPARLVPRHV
jgi:hypothetical protein